MAGVPGRGGADPHQDARRTGAVPAAARGQGRAAVHDGQVQVDDGGPRGQFRERGGGVPDHAARSETAEV